MNNYHQHEAVKNEIKLKSTPRFNNQIRLFDRHVGLFYKKRENHGLINYTPIKINRAGMADLWGVYSLRNPYLHSQIIPVHIEIEIKTGSGRLSEDQITWMEFCISMGWVWILARSAEDCFVQIENKILEVKGTLCNMKQN